MQTVGLSSQVPVLFPVRQLGSGRVAALLLDHLSYELWSRHIDDVERAKPGTPDGPVKTPLYTLETKPQNCKLELKVTFTSIYTSGAF